MADRSNGMMEQEPFVRSKSRSLR